MLIEFKRVKKLKETIEQQRQQAETVKYVTALATHLHWLSKQDCVIKFKNDVTVVEIYRDEAITAETIGQPGSAPKIRTRVAYGEDQNPLQAMKEALEEMRKRYPEEVE